IEEHLGPASVSLPRLRKSGSVGGRVLADLSVPRMVPESATAAPRPDSPRQGVVALAAQLRLVSGRPSRSRRHRVDSFSGLDANARRLEEAQKTTAGRDTAGVSQNRLGPERSRYNAFDAQLQKSRLPVARGCEAPVAVL